MRLAEQFAHVLRRVWADPMGALRVVLLLPPDPYDQAGLQLTPAQKAALDLECRRTGIDRYEMARRVVLEQIAADAAEKREVERARA